MFIVFEGIDGSGKSTQAKRTADWLASRLGEERVLLTREPGGWDGGEKLREFTLASSLSSMWSEFFIFMADRCEHVERVLKPALDAGTIVVCDRYTASTVAYQLFGGAAPETARKFLLRLSDVIGLPKPDAVFWLDVSVAVAKLRLAGRGEGNSFDSKDDAFFERVRTGYKEQMDHASKYGEDISWARIDASGLPDDVFSKIEPSIEKLINSERVKFEILKYLEIQDRGR